MNRLIKDAAVGLTFAGIGSLIVRFNGYQWSSFVILSYIVIAAAIFQGLRYSENSLFSFEGNPLHRLVIVAEGEEMKLKRVLTGEKYKIKGDVEKL